MKRARIIFFVAIVMFLSVNGTTAQTIWKKFSPSGQPFEVSVTGEMKNGEKRILTEVGDLHPITWMYQGAKDDPNFIYSVSYVDYPEGTFHKDSTALVNELFDASIESNIKSLGGTLVYKSESPYGQYQGVIYRASYNDNKAVIKSRMILVNDRFYALQVYTLSEKSLNGDMDKFLNSFRIVK
jgi:hypothetical protein